MKYGRFCGILVAAALLCGCAGRTHPSPATSPPSPTVSPAVSATPSPAPSLSPHPIPSPPPGGGAEPGEGVLPTYRGLLGLDDAGVVASLGEGTPVTVLSEGIPVLASRSFPWEILGFTADMVLYYGGNGLVQSIVFRLSDVDPQRLGRALMDDMGLSSSPPASQAGGKTAVWRRSGLLFTFQETDDGWVLTLRQDPVLPSTPAPAIRQNQSLG